MHLYVLKIYVLKICRLKNKNTISKFWNNKKMSIHIIKSLFIFRLYLEHNMFELSIVFFFE
jgi:hypothetical protein